MGLLVPCSLSLFGSSLSSLPPPPYSAPPPSLLITAPPSQLHGRSREQRYTRLADWPYIEQCAKVASPMPLFGRCPELPEPLTLLCLSARKTGGTLGPWETPILMAFPAPWACPPPFVS